MKTIAKWTKELEATFLVSKIEEILAYDIPYYEQNVLIKQRIEDWRKKCGKK